MEFFSPTSLAEALELLTADDARALAGGQSLMAVMNLELAAPARLVSLRRIDALHGIATQVDGTVRIGAMTTHAALAAWHLDAAGPDLVAQAARVVAYPAVRNFGTIGGAVAHADPAGDYPAALVAAEARIEIASPSGRREVAAMDFFRGTFATAARAGELVTAILVPPGPAGAHARYEKLSIVAGDFAVATVAAMIVTHAGRCTFARLAIGGCDVRPVRNITAEQLLEDRPLDDASIAAAGAALATACDPPSDQRASAAYRRRVVPELVRRAVSAARDPLRA